MFELNNEQLRAVSHIDGPMLVLAGPGSGKTQVLISRVCNLIDCAHVNPADILVLTFSKEAALQMRQRFEQRTNKQNLSVNFGTFHAVFYNILRRQGLYRNSTIINQWKKIEILKTVSKRMGISCSDNNEWLNKMLLYISLKKTNNFKQLEHISNEDLNNLEKLYFPYAKLCESELLIDFDDMVNECLKMLSSNDKIRDKWQSKFKYILVDEFQDIDANQYEVLRLLAGSRPNIFCVGDDDQSIYSFRGANPEIMKKFCVDYPSCQIIRLITNYRCDTSIINIASHIIRNNTERFDKRQEGIRKSENCIAYKNFRNKQDEIKYCISLINANMPGNIGILYRAQRSGDLIEEALKREQIKYYRKDTHKSIYEKDWVKDIFSYLRLAICLNNNDIMRAINRPPRGIVRESLYNSSDIVAGIYEYYAGFDEMINKLNDFFETIEFIKKCNCYSAVNYVLRSTGLRKYIRNNYFSSYSEEEFSDSIEMLTDLARGYSNIKEWIESINNTTNKNSSDDNSSKERDNKIMLMTIHASKGLEFDNVILFDLQEGIFPSKIAEAENNIEEERRLFYVGLTRAKYRLWLLGLRCDDYGKKESRFIKEAGFSIETTGSIIDDVV